MHSQIGRRPARLRVVAVAAMIALVVSAFAFPVLASAATSQRSDPTASQYDPGVTPPQSTGGSGGGNSGLGGNVGPLPFTGFDVIVMAAVALAVTGLGLALQRAVAKQTE